MKIFGFNVIVLKPSKKNKKLELDKYAYLITDEFLKYGGPKIGVVRIKLK